MSLDPQSYLASGLGQMTSELLEEQRARDADQFPLEPTEMAQYVKIHVRGRVGRRPVHADKKVHWPYPFIMGVSQLQMDSTLEDPHFTYGIELKSDLPFIILQAHVRDWLVDDAGLTYAAIVRISAWIPEAPKKQRYDAVFNMTFMGYAAPVEDDDSTNSIFNQA